jgi:hypothetical protein
MSGNRRGLSFDSSKKVFLCEAGRAAWLSHSLPLTVDEPNRTWRHLGAIMLDKPEKTRQLVATLKAALPFEVELTPYALAQIRSQGIDRAVEPRQIVSEVSYAGDEGGIVCHLLPRETDNVIILSLTHVRVHRKNPFAAAVFDYQKHRVKRLKKQSGP